MGSHRLLNPPLLVIRQRVGSSLILHHIPQLIDDMFLVHHQWHVRAAKMQLNDRRQSAILYHP